MAREVHVRASNAMDAFESSDSEADSDDGQSPEQMVAAMMAELDALHAPDAGLESEADSDDETVDMDVPDIAQEVEIPADGNQPTQPVYRWRKRQLLPVDFEFSGPPFEVQDEEYTPLSYFKLFIDDDMIRDITEQTNLYACQKTIGNSGGIPFYCSNDQMEQFIGILLYMGIIKFPSYRMYWSQETKISGIADAMPRNLFETIKKYLHFNDNAKDIPAGQPDRDKLFKVRPFIDGLRKNCLKIPPEEKHSIDEMIIPTKTRWGIRQYNPKKPNKWGIKVWARCGVSGLVYDFKVYTGASGRSDSDNELVKQFGASSAVVAQLCKTLPEGVGHKVYCDNYFSSPDLFLYLAKRKIFSIGTVRSNRLKGAQAYLKGTKDLEVAGRGSFDYVADVNSSLCVVRWLDNGVVNVMSTHVGTELAQPVKRWSVKEKRHVEIATPRMIAEYNSHMGGVDLADMLIALYRVRLGVKKAYLRIFFFGLNMAAMNAWLLYRRHKSVHGEGDAVSLITFLSQIVSGLLKAGKAVSSMRTRKGRPRALGSSQSPPLPEKKRGRQPAIPAPTADVRYDQIGHFPEMAQAKGKCAFCCEKNVLKKPTTFVRCCKCQKMLCFVRERNCFVDFHSK